MPKVIYEKDGRIGRITLNRPEVMNAIDVAAELGTQVFVFWGGREGVEVDASKDPVEAMKWFRE